MRKKQECPCENCLVKVYCRQKDLGRFKYCEPVAIFLGFIPEADTEKHFRNFPIFYDTLKPLRWNYQKWPRGHDRRNKDFMLNICARNLTGDDGF